MFKNMRKKAVFILSGPMLARFSRKARSLYIASQALAVFGGRSLTQSCQVQMIKNLEVVGAFSS